MYAILFLALFIGSLVLIANGLMKERWVRFGGGIGLLVGTILLFFLLGFWGEMLWFEALGQGSRFWTATWARITFAVAGSIFGWAIVFLLTLPISRRARNARIWPQCLGILFGLVWGLASWERGLQWWYGVSTGIVDPILGMDVGFYLFGLPFYDNLYRLLLSLSVVSTIAALVALAIPRNISSNHWEERLYSGNLNFRPLYVALGGLVLVFALGTFLNIFHLMFSKNGVVTGPGWTDVHFRLPAYYILIGVLVLTGVLLLIPGLLSVLSKRIPWSRGERNQQVASSLGSLIAVVVVVWLFGLQIIPGIVQWFVVSPNEITKERPYVANNIKFTQMGFNLDEVEEREFDVSEKLNPDILSRNKHLLDQVRLWDPRALMDVYKQFQEIRLYYEFPDVDIDRYVIDGQYQQVMISPREMAPSNLLQQGQTFVNRRFKYTHGFGLTLAPVNQITSKGLPKLLVKDLPPQSSSPQLEVKEPRIYYGELTHQHVIANSLEEELDYPEGKSNQYNHYSGTGGVKLSNWWRLFVYGAKFDGIRMLLSEYITSESRLLFRRQIRERVQALAPFLEFDADPYIVLHEGRMYWFIDGYTTSEYFPYSEAYFSGEPLYYAKGDPKQAQRTGIPSYLHGKNYVRGSVKAVIDAYNGTVDFYVFEPDDPIIQVWQKIYPGLFKDRKEMPEGLEKHVRYPEGLLLAQGLVYTKYHMTDPVVFYNQEDLWVRATEKYFDKVQPVEPYYVNWESPDTNRAEFILMLPFTPKNRQVLIGWMAGMCDPPNYGRLIAYRFPKKKRVLGTQQVETKIDQDRYLSEKLTLWDQRGSRVIRGNLLVIPLDETLLYVEPIYLEAEAAAYPELRLVAVMHNDKLSYAETFDEALQGLFKEGKQKLPTVEAATGTMSELARQAQQAFDDYRRLQGDGEFEKAGQALERLRKVLQQMNQADGK